jgi:putative ATP-binding cassette transporter
MNSLSETKIPFKLHYAKVLQLLKEFFQQSNNRLSIFKYLFFAMCCVVGLALLNSMFSTWMNIFWVALSEKNALMFISSMKQFLGLISLWSVTSVFKNYFTESFSIHWREWLTAKLLKQYCLDSEQNNYLDLKRFEHQLDNPPQRIQQDVENVVSMTTSMSMDFLNALLRLSTFIGTLWILGGNLSTVILGVSIYLPGYLVWLALGFSGIASFCTHKIGEQLLPYTKLQQTYEANFRKNLEFINHEAESIAQEKGGTYFYSNLSNKLDKIIGNSKIRLMILMRLLSFKSAYQQLSSIFPYIVSSPLYFSGAIDMGGLMQIGYAFGEVNGALNWFIDSYTNLTTYHASISRLIELEKCLQQDPQDFNDKQIVISMNNVNHTTLMIKALCIQSTNQPGHIFKNLNLSLNRGEKVLLKGQSGLGKSTLFKSISGTWKYGQGTINLPCNSLIRVMPQHPSIPHDTLKAIVCYPEAASKYSDESVSTILSQIGLPELVEHLHAENISWSNRLSGGQKQRISFARVILQKPEWLLMDEVTASLDEDSERQLYEIMFKLMVNTTFISIAHRSTVEEYHDKVIELHRDDEGNIFHHSIALNRL